MSDSRKDVFARRSAILASGQISACGGTMYAVASPFLVLLGLRFGLGEGQQGNTIAVFFGAFTLMSIMLPFGLRALAWRPTATVLILLSIGGVAGLAFVRSYQAVLLLMLVMGTGMGGLYTLAITIFGESAQPDRAMGIKIFLETVPGMILCYSLPFLGALYGFYGGLALIVGFAALTGIAVPFLPNGGAKILSAGPRFRPRLPPMIGCVGCFLMAISSFGLWSFLNQVASAQGVSAQVFPILYAAVFLMTGLGALMPAWLGNRYGRANPLIIATALDLLAIAAMFIGRGTPQFAAGALAWGFLNQVILVYLMGFVAEADNTGRVVGFISAAMSAGAVVGPLVAGHLLESFGLPSARLFTMITISGAAATYFLGRARGNDHSARCKQVPVGS